MGPVANGQVRPRPCLAQVRRQRAHPDLVAAVLRPGADNAAPGVGRVHIRDTAVAELRETLDEGVLERQPALLGVTLDRDGALHALEHRPHRVPAPARCTELLPAVVVPRRSAHGHCAVDHRGAARELAASQVDPPLAGDGLAPVAPIVFGRGGTGARKSLSEQVAAGEEGRRRHGLVGEVRARLDQEHRARRILGEAGCDDGAGRPGAHHSHVVALVAHARRV